jgi:multidrug efflux pump subunit AcrA (membrane-fusion protein)
MQLDNHDRKLKAGGYVQAALTLPAAKTVARIPASALINDEKGVHVVMVGPDGKVFMRPVTVARDLGSAIDIAAGLKPGDKIVDSPPDDLSAGDKVKAVAAAPSKAGPSSAGKANG